MPTTNTPILVRTTRNVGPFWHIRIRRMVTGCDYVSFSSTRDETKATDLALKDACRRTAYSTLASFRVVDVIPVTVIERMERVDHDMPHTDIIESAGGGGPIHPDDLHGAVRVDPATNHPDMLPHPSPEATVIATAHANLRRAVEGKGFISMRNEDGTSWLGQYGWGPFEGRTAQTQAKFNELQSGAAATRKNDCPDNGFYGLYNLQFKPCSADEAIEQDAKAATWEEQALSEEDDSAFQPDDSYSDAARAYHETEDVAAIGGEVFNDFPAFRIVNYFWDALGLTEPFGEVLHPAALYSATTAQMYLKSDRLLCGMVMSLHLQYL